jgi:hypothetical protein
MSEKKHKCMENERAVSRSKESASMTALGNWAVPGQRTLSPCLNA